MQINKSKIQLFDVEKIKIHNAAKLNPEYTEEELVSLCDSIETHGQQDPIIFYSNKVIDGRHRVKAFSSLGIKKIKGVNIKNKLTKAEIEEYVINSDNRRHSTQSQRAVSAFFYYLKASNSDYKITQGDASRRFGVSIKLIKTVASINKMGRRDILDNIHNGLNIISPLDPRKKSNSISTVYAWLKEFKEIEKLGNYKINAVLTEEKEELIDNLFCQLVSNAKGSLKIMKAYNKKFNYLHKDFEKLWLKHGDSVRNQYL